MIILPKGRTVLGAIVGTTFSSHARKRKDCFTRQVRKKPRTLSSATRAPISCINIGGFDAPVADADSKDCGASSKIALPTSMTILEPTQPFCFAPSSGERGTETNCSASLKRVREALDHNRSKQVLESFSTRATKGCRKAKSPSGKKRVLEEQLLPQAKHTHFIGSDVCPSLGSSRLSSYIQRGVIPANFLFAQKQAPSRKRPAEALNELDGSPCYKQPSAASSGASLGVGGASSGSGAAGNLTPKNEENHVNPRSVFPPKVSRLTRQGR